MTKTITITDREAELYEQFKKELQRKEEKWEIGEQMFVVNGNGTRTICNLEYLDGSMCNNAIKYGLAFKTIEEAERKLLRLEAGANPYIPKKFDRDWAWSFVDNKPVKICYAKEYTADAYAGAIHKTKESCQEWGGEFAKAFKQNNNE